MDQPFETDFSTVFPERKPLYPDDFGTRRRDLAALLEVLREIVAEYQPGATLMKKRAAAAGGAGDD